MRPGWASQPLAGFAASAVLLAAFIVRERRAAHPMLDVRHLDSMPLPKVEHHDAQPRTHVDRGRQVPYDREFPARHLQSG